VAQVVLAGLDLLLHAADLPLAFLAIADDAF
jgi:hypothetical protein